MLRFVIWGLCCALINGQTCEYEGIVHHNGASFPSTDGCNTCHCFQGAVACTLKFCLPSGGLSSCNYNGTTHNTGASFPALDGCNTCICDHGLISCTKMFCMPATVDPPIV